MSDTVCVFLFVCVSLCVFVYDFLSVCQVSVCVVTTYDLFLFIRGYMEKTDNIQIFES